MENTNSLGLLLSFARPCRRLLAASVGLAVLGVASGSSASRIFMKSDMLRASWICMRARRRREACSSSP